MSEESRSENITNDFPAGQFVQAREQQGLSVEQVCRQLNLSKAVVQAIEKGDLQYLSDPVFSRGYIRSYAKFLKLDADALVASYNLASGNVQTTGTVKAIGTVSTVPGRHQGRPLLRIGSWLFVLALIAASVWWWQTQQGFTTADREPLDDRPFSIETSDGKTLVLPQVDDAVSEVEVTEDGEAAAAAPDVTPENEEPVYLTDDQVQQLQEAQAAASSIAEPEVPAPVSSGLDITFSDDCWISIREVGGRTLFNGVAQAGQSLKFESDATLAVVVGKVDAVSLFSYQGKSIDLAAMSKDNVARLSLPL
ncbi:RodZ domain-containing protein [Marinobacterium sp. MBR-109]|uniref:RodZ domain-containing protein n=1 Tax=Marinobacterium sp. MBR-109 TaxID=3156462 RepID=UPI0033910326